MTFDVNIFFKVAVSALSDTFDTDYWSFVSFKLRYDMPVLYFVSVPKLHFGIEN